MGRPRKDPRKLSRARDVRRHLEADAAAASSWTDLPWRPFEVPELPDGHRPETVKWYESWRGCESARRRLTSPTDWGTLQLLAGVVDLWWASVEAGDLDLGAFREIRLTESKLGATVGDRLRMARKQPA